MNKKLIKKAIRIDELLAEEYGAKKFDAGTDPLTELVVTVLSQNTSDTNRDRAFKELKRRFPDWDDVLTASRQRLESAIKVGGLARIKSGRILKMLRSIKKKHGELNLDFLTQWTESKVRNYLLELDGVGPKTAACVLAFSLGRDVMPVDTHVFRVAGRLGLLPEKTTPEKAHEYFLELRGSVSLYQFHLNLIAHGRNICKAQNPLCAECKLKRLCNYYAEVVRNRGEAA
jgi:endonuclease-3